MKQKFLDTKEAAEYIGMSPRTLEAWRRKPSGLVYYMYGQKILYEISDLNKWIKNRKPKKIERGM